jgi:hypothetical protein
MLENIDYINWIQKICPFAWQGVYKDHKEDCNVVLEIGFGEVVENLRYASLTGSFPEPGNWSPRVGSAFVTISTATRSNSK